jgi:hypothetical protein
VAAATGVPDPRWSAITWGLSAAKGVGAQDGARPEGVTFEMSMGRSGGETRAAGEERSRREGDQASKARREESRAKYGGKKAVGGRGRGGRAARGVRGVVPPVNIGPRRIGKLG